LAIGDFWDFVSLRAKKAGKKVYGLRQDWIKRYPALLGWKLDDFSKEVLHCEVKLALDCLNRRRNGKVVIGVSKQPCYCCETWFGAMNIKAKNIKFVLAAGHKKVYSGWRPSGLEEGDKKVISKIWGMMDSITSEVKRVEEKDLVPALPLKTQVDDGSFTASEIAEISKIASNLYSIKGYTCNSSCGLTL
jgi:hypothetical protein